MKFFLAIGLLCASSFAQAVEVPPHSDQELANVLGLMTELSRNDGTILIQVPVELGECWGSNDSCPDVRLLVVMAPDALGQETVMFEMPLSKGWALVEWHSWDQFVVETTIPEHNRKPEEREAWESIRYQVTLSPNRNLLMYEVVD